MCRAKISIMLKNNISGVWRGIAAALFWIAVWWAAALAVSNPLLLPGPAEVCVHLASMAATADFWLCILYSMLRVLAGFAAGCAAGVILAVLTHCVPLLKTLFSPLMSMIKSVPVASFIMLVILVLKRDVLPVFICFIMVLPIIWSAVSLALETVPEQYKEFAAAYGLSIRKRLFRLYLPWTLPHLAQGTVTALGFAWKAGIAAEVLCQPSDAIGSGIYASKIYLEVPQLFAWTVVVILLSIVLEKLLKYLMRRAKGKRAYQSG